MVQFLELRAIEDSISKLQALFGKIISKVNFLEKFLWSKIVFETVRLSEEIDVMEEIEMKPERIHSTRQVSQMAV